MQELLGLIEEASQKYHRLVVVVVDASDRNFSLPSGLDELPNKSLVNLNLELSRQLLGLSKKARPLKAADFVSEIVERQAGQLVVLENIEILFEPTLRLCGLEVLKSVSRDRNVVAIWPGQLSKGNLIYAQAGCAEYKSYRCVDSGVVFYKVDQEG